MNMARRKAAPKPAPIQLRPEDRVSWFDRSVMSPRVRTGTVKAVAGDIANVLVDDGGYETPVGCAILTIIQPTRDEAKAAALIAVHAALSERAEAGDLTAWAFLTDDWPQLVPADLRALLDIGPDHTTPELKG